MKKRANDSLSFSHAEFDALPLSVQRKYFSSVERLRISEQQSLQDLLQYETSRRSSHSLARSIALHPSLALSTHRRRIRKAESVRIRHDLAQQEAEFFLSLPPKIRKQYFSPEEQVLLAGRCEQPSLPDLSALHRAQQRFHDFDFFDDSDRSPERGRSRRRSRSISPVRVPFDRDHQDAHLGPDDSPLHINTNIMSPPTAYQVARQGRPYRRTLSLSNIPARYSISSAPPLIDPPLLTFGPQRPHRRSTSLSRSGRRSSHAPAAPAAPTPPVFDPEATHYQDPEARKKLRMYLGSPQKFDEAVEFGFPSTAGNDTVTPRYQLPPITTDARNFSRDMQTFLRDDTMSFLEDKEDEDEDVQLASDGDSVTDLESPVTPSSTGLSFRCHTRHASPSNFSSLDSTGIPAHPMQSRLNREMTLRMTLTRPDLRADEDHLYGWQAQKGGKDDPFALEELHLTDDMTGSNGAFAVKPKPHGNLVSRLFKRASKRGR